MIGCRAVTREEVTRLLAMADRLFCESVSHRLKAMIVLAMATGLRIQEIRTLRCGDICTAGRCGESVYARRTNMKAKRAGRRVPLSNTAREHIQAWLDYSGLGSDSTAYLFPPAKGSWSHKPLYWSDRCLDDRSARKNLDALIHACELSGHVSWHSFRKYFAGEFYRRSGNNLIATRSAMGHSRIDSTMSYLASDDSEVAALILQLT